MFLEFLGRAESLNQKPYGPGMFYLDKMLKYKLLTFKNGGDCTSKPGFWPLVHKKKKKNLAIQPHKATIQLE